MPEQTILNFDHTIEILKPFQFCVNRQKGEYEVTHEMTHLFYLYFIMHGNGEILTKDGLRKFHERDIICVFPGNTCGFSFHAQENEWYWISVEVGNNVELSYWNQSAHEIMVFSGEITEQMAGTIVGVVEQEKAGRGKPYRILGVLYTLMDKIFDDSSVRENGSTTAARDSQSVSKAIEYIGLNYYHKIDVDSICRYVNYSRYYFSRRFKEIQGVSITEYINKVRLDRAVYLLNHTDLTVVQVASSVGFDDPYYFSKKFKAYTGVAPSLFKTTYT